MNVLGIQNNRFHQKVVQQRQRKSSEESSKLSTIEKDDLIGKVENIHFLKQQKHQDNYQSSTQIDFEQQECVAQNVPQLKIFHLIGELNSKYNNCKLHQNCK